MFESPIRRMWQMVDWDAWQTKNKTHFVVGLQDYLFIYLILWDDKSVFFLLNKCVLAYQSECHPRLPQSCVAADDLTCCTMSKSRQLWGSYGSWGRASHPQNRRSVTVLSPCVEVSWSKIPKLLLVTVPAMCECVCVLSSNKMCNVSFIWIPLRLFRSHSYNKRTIPKRIETSSLARSWTSCFGQRPIVIAALTPVWTNHSMGEID